MGINQPCHEPISSRQTEKVHHRLKHLLLPVQTFCSLHALLVRTIQYAFPPGLLRGVFLFLTLLLREHVQTDQISALVDLRYAPLAEQQLDLRGR